MTRHSFVCSKVSRPGLFSLTTEFGGIFHSLDAAEPSLWICNLEFIGIEGGGQSRVPIWL